MKPTQQTATNIVILGSTGSIGTQTLDIAREYPEKFQVVGLAARRNWELLASQAREFLPLRVVIADKNLHGKLQEALADLNVEVEAGDEAIADLAAMTEADTVVTAMVGYSGLVPTIHAIGAGKRIALANKETLVVAGELITGLLKNSESEILLTASGGPFRKLSESELKHVTVKDALRHPNWDMGAKVTIDSASMMNKGFEMIEARWLFDCPAEKIEISVHPQSVVHSMVEFCDGSVKAQLGVPDMHLPIRYALGYPERLATDAAPLSLTEYGTLTFEDPDMKKFPLLGMAFEAIEKGGNMPCILNAANEVAVAAFLNNKIRFTDMPDIVKKTMAAIDFIEDVTLDNLIHTNLEARRYAEATITGE